MDRERYQRLKRILGEVLDRPASEREAYLDQECGSDLELREAVLEMLEDTGRETEALSPVGPVFDPIGDLVSGARIGHYELIDRIGEGGMGSVWRARQEVPVRREVAVKVLRQGARSHDLLRRFEDERQLLARLDHPGLARVFDGGVAGDKPYFVMELVRGTTLDCYCHENGLGLRARLELFLQACRAVQHAHQKGIIHRDLKPSNVLVSEMEGQPIVKVIDFGIAKVIEDDGEPSTRIDGGSTIVGTPDYMSPEQARGAADIDTRTDVYSLGVVLYALLTERLPFDRSSDGLNGVFQRIQASEPTRPSLRLRSETERPNLEIPSDLDWIALRCLEKEPQRRYATADALARDVDRFLSDRPVEAAPPSAWYRAKKAYRRHRAAVLTSFLGIIILVLGALGTTFGLLEATRANELLKKAVRLAEDEATRATAAEGVAKQRADEAAREARIAEAVNDFLNEDLLGAVVPSDEDGKGRDVSMRTVLDAAGVRIERAGQPGGRFAEMPLVEAAIRMTLGNTYRMLGVFEPARGHFERAVELYEEHPDASPERRFSASSDLAVILADLGEVEAAEQLLAGILERYGDEVSFDHVTSVMGRLRLGNLYRRRGEFDAALRLFEGLLRQCEERLGEGDALTQHVLGSYARAHVEAGHTEKAGELFRRNLEMSRRYFGPKNPSTLDALTNYAAFLTAQRRHEEAKPLLSESLGLNRDVYGPEHPKTLATMHNLGILAQQAGNHEEARQYLEERLEILRRTLGEEHPDTLQCQMNLGESLDFLGEVEEGERLLRDALDKIRETRGANHPDWFSAAKLLLRFLYRHDRLDDAGPLFREVLEREERVLGPNHPNTLNSLFNLALYRRRLDQHDEAIRLIRDAVRRSTEVRGVEDPATIDYRLELIKLLEAANRNEAALEECRRVAEITRDQLPELAKLHAKTLQHLGANLLDLGEKDPARAVLEEAVQVARDHLSKDTELQNDLEELLKATE
ncbi:MAG: serine/threonine-protein kinase [Planctomycetota bacterium]